MHKLKTCLLLLAITATPLSASATERWEEISAVNRDTRCAPQVSEALGEFGIEPEDVTRSNVMPVSMLHDGSYQIMGWEAYLARRSCPGTTVIEMKLDCTVTGRRDQGGC
ncbi:MAG: hypothetical protein QNJ92_16380 [Alphaproteobacteria bacterium]|nr:hypothetical protein [Alphaproteobacteria bacterium]